MIHKYLQHKIYMYIVYFKHYLTISSLLGYNFSQCLCSSESAGKVHCRNQRSSTCCCRPPL